MASNNMEFGLVQNEFRHIYENCLNIINRGIFYLYLTNSLQYIRKVVICLWEQNSVLIHYASNAKCLGTNIVETNEKLQNDINNLLLIIGKLQSQGEANTTDLVFYTLPETSIARSSKIQVASFIKSPLRNRSMAFASGSDLSASNTMSCGVQEDKDSGIEEQEDEDLKAKIQKLEIALQAERTAVQERDETIKCLKKENAELKEDLQEVNVNFKEMRWALTTEVANKHDQILDLRRLVGGLEDQLREAHMQTQFKDENIKKLREELKERGRLKTTGRKLYDIVTEVKEFHDRKLAMLPKSDSPTSVSTYPHQFHQNEDHRRQVQVHQEQVVRNLEFSVRARNADKEMSGKNHSMGMLYDSPNVVSSSASGFDFVKHQLIIKEKEDEINRLRENLQSSLKKQEDQGKELIDNQKVISNLVHEIKNLKQSEGNKRDREISSLRFEVCELDLKRRNSLKEIEKKKEEINHLILENTNLREKFRLMICNVIELETQLSIISQLYEMQKDEKCSIENGFLASQPEIARLQQEVSHLKEKLKSEEQKAEKDRERFNKSISEHKIKTGEIIKSNHELKILSDNYKLSLTELENQNKHLVEKVKSFNSDENLMEKVAYVEQLLKESEFRQVENNKIINELRRKLEESNQQYQLERAESQKIVKQTEEKYRSMLAENYEEVQCLQKNNATLVEELKENSRKLKKFESEETGEIKKLQEDLAEQISKYNNLLTENERFRMELEKSRESLTVVQNKMDKTARTYRFDIEDVRKLRKSFEETLGLVRAQHEIDKKKLEQLEQEYKEKSKKELSEKLLLKKKLTQKEVEHEQLYRNTRQAEDEIENLRKKLEVSERELESLQESHSKCITNFQFLDEKLESYSKIIQQQGQELKNYEELNVDLRNGLCEEQKNNEHLREQLQSISQYWENELTGLRQELSYAEAQVRDYESRMVPKLESQIMRLSSLLDHYKMEAERANQSCQSMRKEAMEVIKSSKALTDQRNINKLTRAEHISAIQSLTNSLREDDKRERQLYAAFTEMRVDSEQPESGFQSMLQSPNPYVSTKILSQPTET